MLLHGADSGESSAAPNPQRLNRPLELESVDAQRHVTCDRYDRCLDSAIEQEWPSWTCESCRRFGIALAILLAPADVPSAAAREPHLFH